MKLEKAKAIFENYNNVLKKTYEEFFSNLDKDVLDTDISDKSEENIEKLLNAFKLEAEVKWESLSADYLDGLTPLEYFEGIDDLDKLFEIFKLGAKACDDGIPDALLKKMKAFGNKAVDGFMELALNNEYYSDQYKKFISLFAIQTLGKWKVDKLVRPIIEIIFSLSDNEDEALFKEYIQEALENIGETSIGPVMAKLESAEIIGDTHEYLVVALSKVGSKNRSDSLYRCLKNTFLKMQNKSIGALSLAVYGDGRAIPALRGYAEKNRDNLDRETLFDIGTAIKRLGGSADDIL